MRPTRFVSAEVFSDSRYDGPRRTATAIYYLLEPDTFSEMHVLASDEIFHHYAGDAVEMLQLHPDGSSRHVVIGRNFARASGRRSLSRVACGRARGCCRLRSETRMHMAGRCWDAR